MFSRFYCQVNVLHCMQCSSSCFPLFPFLNNLLLNFIHILLYTLCLKKNRTPITFWNNSPNKLCLIIIMISWENHQKVLNIVVCYRLTIFHKTGYQLRMNWSSAWWRSGLAYGRPLSMTQSTNGEDVSGHAIKCWFSNDYFCQNLLLLNQDCWSYCKR